MATNVSTVGSVGRDYANLPLWESDRDGVGLYAEIADCYNDSVEDSATTLSGWSTGIGTYIEIRAADGEGHDGTEGTGYRLVYTGSASLETIYVREDYVRIRQVEFHTGSSGAAHQFAVKIDTDITATNDIRLNKLLITGESDSTGRGIKLDDTDIKAKVWNCIVMRIDNNSVDAAGLLVVNASAVYAYNNTFNLNKYGIKVNAGTVYAKNNACFDNVTDDFNGSYHADSDYNVSSDTTAPGENSLISKTSTDNFVSVGSGTEDFNVKDINADIYGYGADLSEDTYLQFFDDVAGNDRIQWDVGAFEFVAGDASKSLVIAKKNYSAHKVGMTFLECVCKVEDVMTDIGDKISVDVGNPAVTFDKAIVFKVSRKFGDQNRIIIKAFTGGFMYDEDGAWA
jgi:hypothetical protein